MGSPRKASPAGSAPEVVAIRRNELPSYLDKLCERRISVEVVDLYDSFQPIRDGEFLRLDDSLKARGFTASAAGRGNWTGGPRIVSVELLSKAGCRYRVDKLYHDPASAGGRYRATERLIALP